MLLPHDDVSTFGGHFAVENRGEMSPTPSVLPQPRCISRLCRGLVLITAEQRFDIFDLVHQNDALDAQW
jgi:hypothetical protein